MSKTKKRLNFLTCALIALVMALSCLALTGNFAAVRADSPDYFYKVDIPDGQFAGTGSSIIMGSSNWTGDYIGDFTGNADDVSGIVDLSADASDLKEFLDATKLDQYSEYTDKRPTTPFGKDQQKYSGTNTNVLLINTNDSDSHRRTAYGFKSSDITLDPYSFYSFSVWVKTGSFASGTGAVIKLSGLKYDIGFWDIDNSNLIDNNMLGFSEYEIYVATAGESATITINLQVGDNYSYGEIGNDDYIGHINPASGYAMFDNVTGKKLSANAFYNEIRGLDSERVVIHDFNEDGVLTSEVLRDSQGNEIGSFKNGLGGWTPVFKEGVMSGQFRYLDVVDASVPFDENNAAGLDSAPYTPMGNSETLDDRNILAITADKKEVSVGVESDDITIKRNSFYRIAFWANSQNLGGDSFNASAVIKGENNIPGNDYKLEDVVLGDVNGSGDANTRYGWQRFFIYFRGSVAKDCNVKLQLWLGYNENCIGAVLFDDIRLERLSYAQFNESSTDQTIVTFDSVPDTTIDNGRFFDAEDYDGEYPLKPAQWTQIGTLPSGAASGIILTDAEHYSANADKYFHVNNPISQNTMIAYNNVDYPSVLLLATREPGYFGYASPTLTVTNNNSYKITVSLRASEMTGSGANLWISNQNTTISAIRNIPTGRDFHTYEFYVQGDKPFTSGTGVDYELTLNIAMGNSSKTATGNIYVAEATFESITEDDFNAKLQQYQTEKRNTLDYAVYSFSSLDFSGYDAEDTSAIKKTNSWITTAMAEDANGNYEMGVFDPNYKENNVDEAYIPASVTKAYNKLENSFANVFTLQTRKTSVTAQLVNPLKLNPNSYYMVSVWAAVIIHQDETSQNKLGANIFLTGDEKYSQEAKFENILNTVDTFGELAFKQYQFYILSSNEDANLHLEVSLGNSAYPNGAVKGEIYVAYVSLVDLGSSDDTLEASDTLKIIDKHVDSDADSDNSTNDDATDDNVNTSNTSDSEKWWLIPSILFGIAIILAIVGSVIRILIEKSSRKQRRKELSSYDRRIGYDTNSSDESDKFNDTTESSDTTNKAQDVSVDEFDDDKPNDKPNNKPDDKPEASVEEPIEQKKVEKKSDNNDDINSDFDD